MFYAIITNSTSTEESNNVHFFKATPQQALDSFDSKLRDLESSGEEYEMILITSDEMTQANLLNEDGCLRFDSTVVACRIVDTALDLNAYDYMIHA